MAKFRDVLEIRNGRNQRAVEATDGQYPIYGSGGIMGYANDYLCPAETTVLGRKGTINKPFFVEKPFWNVDTAFGLVANHQKLLPKYLYYFCCNHDFLQYSTTVTIPSLTKANLLDIDIHLPSIAEQHATVLTLDNVAALVGLQKLQLKKLDLLVKSRFVEMFGDPETNPKNWPIAHMCDICSVGSSKRIYQSEQSIEGVPFWRISDLTNVINTGLVTANQFVPQNRYEELRNQGQVPLAGDILITSRGTLGQCYIVKDDDKFYFQDGMISWLSEYDESVTPLYIAQLFAMPGFHKQIDSMQAGSTVAYLSIAMIKKLIVMLPDMETQQQFAAFVSQVDKSKLVVQKALDEEQKLFDSLMQQYFG